MNIQHFTKAFDRLALPITTANENLVEGWSVNKVWKPYWATTSDYYYHNQAFADVISLLLRDTPYEGTDYYRQDLQKFVDQYLTGYKLIYEADILDALNEVMIKEGHAERVLGFRYGKDGRGSMPDRYYHLLFKNKYLVLGNHHDILGHLVLLADPEIRELTERLSIGFSAALEFQHQLRSSTNLPEREFNQQTEGLRKILRLYTLAWNLCQEKLYIVTQTQQQEPVLNLVGAFNSVYNTIFSDRLKDEQSLQVAGALGFFNRDPQHSILMPPQALKEYCQSIADGDSVKDLLSAYEQRWTGLGLNPENKTSEHLATAFHNVIKNSLFKKSFFKKSNRQRWLELSNLVLADQELKAIFCKDSLLGFATDLVKLSEGLFEQYRRQRQS